MLELLIVAVYTAIHSAITERRLWRKRRELTPLGWGWPQALLLPLATGFLIGDWWVGAVAPLSMLAFIFRSRKQHLTRREVWGTIVIGTLVEAALLMAGCGVARAT